MELQEYGDLINLESPISKTSKRIAFFLLGLYALCLLLVFISFIFIRETTIRDVLINIFKDGFFHIRWNSCHHNRLLFWQQGNP